MYPSEWHRVYGERTGASADAIMAHLVSIFRPSSVVEIGCGNAHWTRAAAELGVADYVVADGPWNDRKDLLVPADRFREIDLRGPVDLGRRFDMAICLEVAEHVAADHADTIVASLAAMADVILFGAAIPLQGGHGHVNEQWPSWWRAKFSGLGLVPFDLVRPKFWTDTRLHYWYRQNAWVYVNPRNAAMMARAGAAAAALAGADGLIDAVHPEKYDEMVSYRSIAFKRLVRRLPAWAAKRARAKLSGQG